MAAFVLTTAGTTLIYTPSGGDEAVEIQNLGPNPIFIGPATPVDPATALSVPAGSMYSVPSGMRTAIYARTITANQIAGAETRVQVWAAT
jgi:hypothetical protein